MRGGAIILATTIALISGAPGAAQETPQVENLAIQAAISQDVQLGLFANVNQACTGLPAPSIRIATPPTQGVLTVKLVVLGLKPDSKSCPDKKIPALGLYYRTTAKGAASDTVRVETVAGTSAKTHSFAISITGQKE